MEGFCRASHILAIDPTAQRYGSEVLPKQLFRYFYKLILNKVLIKVYI